MKSAIIIPARYGSTRFPGKPLAVIGGKSMLARVVDVARAAATDKNIAVAVATEDQRIADHCAEIGVACHITSPDCPTGSDRVLAAAKLSGGEFDYIFSLQGDAPFTPPHVLTAMLAEIGKRSDFDVITPVHRLSWAALGRLREAKKTTPFSGTTVTRRPDGRALYFSKNIIPAIRDEIKLRDSGAPCPVFQHIGVYGYRRDILERFVKLPQSDNEMREGLEQLRLLDHGIDILTVAVTFEENSLAAKLQGGIDSPEDMARAERLLKEYGAS